MTPQEIQRELEELETRLERLRIKYEQYFTGIEKMVPFVQRKDVDRRFAALHKEQMRNSGLRFRFNTLVQRFTSLQTHWGRTIRKIEEGTYRRDVIRAKRLAQRLDAGDRPQADAPTDDAGPEFELSADDLEDASENHAVEAIELPPVREPAPAPVPVPAPTPAPVPTTSPMRSLRAPSMVPTGAASPGSPAAAPRSMPAPARPLGSSPTNPTLPRSMPAPARPAGSSPANPVAPSPSLAPRPLARPAASLPPARTVAPRPPMPAKEPEDPQLRALHQRFVEARRTTGENTDVRYETIAAQARATLPKLAAKYQGADVRLDVTIKDGKAVLKPIVVIPKKA